MPVRFKPQHLVMVVVIVAVFLLWYITDIAIPDWLFFALAALVVIGALFTFIQDYRQAGEPERAERLAPRDPPFVNFLFNDVRTAPVWLILRLYLGLQWLESGWGKVTEDAWMDGGEALRSYWERIVIVPEEGRPVISYDWYREFIQYMLDNEWYTWFGPVIAISEVLIGVALILGILVGFAAAGGLLMNTAFMLAGSASTNPVLGAISILLILAWKVAGFWGADRYLLPALGAPWDRGWLTGGQREAESPTTTPAD